VLSFGTAPSPAFGFSAAVSARYRMASLTLEGQATLPAGRSFADGSSVHDSVLLASLAPCLHVRIARGCVVGSLGALRGGAAGLAHPNTVTTGYGSVGARAGVEIPVYGPLAVDFHADLAATLTRTTLDLNGMPAWTTPPLSGALAAGVAARFW
jgi:hypothetical protein